MKKKIVLFLATLMCVSLCACSGSESTSGDNNSETKTEQNGVTPSQPIEETEETENKKETLIVDDIDRDNLQQYYDTTKFSGNPTLCYGIYYIFNGKASFELYDLSRKGIGSIEIEPIEELLDSHKYFCIMTDNDNTPDNISDDTLAYIFTTPIE